jgi:hypothetical protein
LGGVFIKVKTYGNFNCGFRIWNSNVSFDGIKLMVIFVVFELEVVVVIIVISGLGVLLLLLVTLSELMVLYL